MNNSASKNSAARRERLTGSALLSAASALPDEAPASLAKSCGYAGKTRLPVTAFYRALIKATGQATAGPHSERFRKHLHEQVGGFSPLVESGRIIGRYELRISPRADEKIWTRESWQGRQRGVLDEMDGPYEVITSGSEGMSWESHFDYGSAIACFSPARAVDLLRPAYAHLGDDVNGMTLEEFLCEYGEQPADLLALSKAIFSEE